MAFAVSRGLMPLSFWECDTFSQLGANADVPLLPQSLTAAAGSVASRARPIFDLAFNPEEMKKRLSSIPVFAVVNSKNEFVLVTGDDGVRQLGMFFFSKEDAEGFISTVSRRVLNVDFKPILLPILHFIAYQSKHSPCLLENRLKSRTPSSARLPAC